MSNISNRTVIEIIIAAWIIIAAYYNIHSPDGCRSRDFWAHVEYAEIIANQHRLPKPYEGWESHQTPLYYLLVTSIAPASLSTEITKDARIYYGRALSVLFGAISLGIMAWCLQQFNIKPVAQLLALLFIATTPKFVFIFSMFNNDSLATLFSIATVAVSYRLYHRWSKYLAKLLLFVAAASLYSKLSAIISIGCVFLTILAICIKNLLQKKIPHNRQIRIMLLLALSVVLLFPYLVFHNYKHTGRLNPTNIDSSMDRKYNFAAFKNQLGVLFRIRGLQQPPPDYTHEFDEPWILPTWGYLWPATKRFDTFTYTFIISILDEFRYSKPSTSIIWLILGIHLISGLIPFLYILKSGIIRLSTWILLLANIGNIALMMTAMLATPVPNADFRYIAWSWLPWAALYGYGLTERSKLSFILKATIAIGILLQIYTIIVLTGCTSE